MPPGKFTFKSKKTDSKLTQQSILGFINPSPKPTVGCDLKREHKFLFYFTKVMENRLDDKNTTANSRFCVKYPTQCDRSSLFYQTGIVSFFESYFFHLTELSQDWDFVVLFQPSRRFSMTFVRKTITQVSLLVTKKSRELKAWLVLGFNLMAFIICHNSLIYCNHCLTLAKY